MVDWVDYGTANISCVFSWRLQEAYQLGVWPNHMRYQPLDAITKNSYGGENWTERELKRYMRYWSRLRWLRQIPFDEYRR